MDNIETELEMLNHMKQLLGDMDKDGHYYKVLELLLKQKLKHTTPEEKREKHNQYHKNYYHNSKLSDVVVCDICHKDSTVQKIKRHQGSLWCAKHRLFHNDI